MKVALKNYILSKRFPVVTIIKSVYKNVHNIGYYRYDVLNKRRVSEIYILSTLLYI